MNNNHCAPEVGPPLDSGTTPSTEESTHEDTVLVAQLVAVTTQLARYVLRYTDAEINQSTPVTATDEHVLADCLSTAAEALRARATRRDQQPNG